MMWVIDKRHDYWGDVYAKGIYVSGDDYEIMFSVKESGNYNIKTYSTIYSGDHLTDIGLSTFYNTAISYPLEHNYSEYNGESGGMIKSALNNVPLTAGSVYKLYVTNYSGADELNCLLTIINSSSNITTPVICYDYSVIKFDEYYTDYIDDSPPYQLGGCPLINYFTCLRYAFTTYDNHYYNTRFIYNTYINDGQIGYVPVGYTKEQFDEIKNNASQLGYRFQDYYSPNCVIIYEGMHYAVSINGIITAKMGQGQIVKHSAYDVYLNTWQPIGFFVREQST